MFTVCTVTLVRESLNFCSNSADLGNDIITNLFAFYRQIKQMRSLAFETIFGCYTRILETIRSLCVVLNLSPALPDS